MDEALYNTYLQVLHPTELARERNYEVGKYVKYGDQIGPITSVHGTFYKRSTQTFYPEKLEMALPRAKLTIPQMVSHNGYEYYNSLTVLDMMPQKNQLVRPAIKDVLRIQLFYVTHPDKFERDAIDAKTYVEAQKDSDDPEIEQTTKQLITDIKWALGNLNRAEYYVYAVVDTKKIPLEALQLAEPQEIAQHFKTKGIIFPEWAFGSENPFFDKYKIGGAMWSALAKRVRVYVSTEHHLPPIMSSATAAQMVVSERMPLKPSGYTTLYKTFGTLPPVVGVLAETVVEKPVASVIDVLSVAGPILAVNSTDYVALHALHDSSDFEAAVLRRLKQCCALVFQVAKQNRKTTVAIPVLGTVKDGMQPDKYHQLFARALRQCKPDGIAIVVLQPLQGFTTMSLNDVIQKHSPLTLIVNDWGAEMIGSPGEPSFYAEHTALTSLTHPAMNANKRGIEVDTLVAVAAAREESVEILGALAPSAAVYESDYQILAQRADDVELLARETGRLISQGYVPCADPVIDGLMLYLPFLRLAINDDDIDVFWNEFTASQRAHIDLEAAELEAHVKAAQAKEGFLSYLYNELNGSTYGYQKN